MKFRNALVAATILALPVAAKAQPISGLYVGGGAGVNIMLDENATANVPHFGSVSGNLPSHPGAAADVSIGYGLGNGLRMELEGAYTYNSFYTSGGPNIGGHEQKYGPMVNVLYDFVGLVPYVQPYVGVGAGYMWAQENDLHASGAGLVAGASNHTVGEFAYQAIIGAALPIASVPGLALTVDYRFMGLTGNRDYSGGVSGIVNGKTVSGNVRLNDDYNNIVTVGFRYAFGVAPAPVAPAAVVVPPSPVSRSYLVFFDWDRADLTDRARQIVSEAATNSTRVQYTRLEVNGYTDTSGTPKYNQGLSVRRAQSVAAELVKDGVPKAAISIQGFGETHLLFPTGAGVREPQNRRVEIIIK